MRWYPDMQGERVVANAAALARRRERHGGGVIEE
jgi:hypothetical protein